MFHTVRSDPQFDGWFYSCSKEDDVENLLVGRWYEDLNDEWYMVFLSDGRGYEYESESFQDWFTWTYDKSSKKLIQVYDEDQYVWFTQVVSVTSNELRLKEENGEIYIYFKK